MNWYLMVWRRYAEFNGRSRRTEYWVFVLINCLVLLALAAVFFAGFAISKDLGSVLLVPAGLYYLASLIPSLAVSVRRFHDTGKGGWLVGLLLVLDLVLVKVPFAGIVPGIIQLVILCWDSDRGPNKYGPNPKSSEDPKTADECLKAAEQGDASAQYNLGIMYDHGQGVPQDYAQAALCYRKAAEQGYAPAQSNLGAAYYEGQGVPRDYAQAAAWFHKAAVQGDATAQFNLGAAYLDGQGVPQDYAAATHWLDRAASGKLEGINAEELAKLRAETASHLSPAVLAEAQERWRKQTSGNSSGSVTRQAQSLPPQPQPFESFQHPRLVVGTFNLFQQLFMLMVGGWAIILVQALVSIPVLAVGLVVYALRRRSVLPHNPSKTGPHPAALRNPEVGCAGGSNRCRASNLARSSLLALQPRNGCSGSHSGRGHLP